MQGEHARLVESFSPHDVVCDAFAGVGPFAIPAGKKGCGVLASDLNPSSASALADNAKTNKVQSRVTSEQILEQTLTIFSFFFFHHVTGS